VAFSDEGTPSQGFGHDIRSRLVIPLGGGGLLDYTNGVELVIGDPVGRFGIVLYVADLVLLVVDGFIAARVV
jgi:hypothetical protein